MAGGMKSSETEAARRLAELQDLMDRAYELLDRNNAQEALKLGVQLEQRRYSGGFEIQARALCALHRPAEAINALERGVAAVPENASLWQFLGNCRSDSRDYAGAFRAYETALACGAEPVELGYNLALALSRSGRTGEARDRLESLVGTADMAACDPRLGELIVDELEALLRDEGRHDDADALIDRFAAVLARAALGRDRSAARD